MILYICCRIVQKQKHEEALKRVQAYEERKRREGNDDEDAESEGFALDDGEDDQKTEPMLSSMSRPRASFNLMENANSQG